MGAENKSVIPPGVKRGDFVLVHWSDISTDSSGHPSKAETCPGLTPAFYWGVKKEKQIDCLVCYETHRPGWEDGEEDGSHIFPLSIVRKIEVLRKKKDLKFNGEHSPKNR